MKRSWYISLRGRAAANSARHPFSVGAGCLSPPPLLQPQQPVDVAVACNHARTDRGRDRNRFVPFRQRLYEQNEVVAAGCNQDRQAPRRRRVQDHPKQIRTMQPQRWQALPCCRQAARGRDIVAGNAHSLGDRKNAVARAPAGALPTHPVLPRAVRSPPRPPRTARPPAATTSPRGARSDRSDSGCTATVRRTRRTTLPAHAARMRESNPAPQQPPSDQQAGSRVRLTRPQSARPSDEPAHHAVSSAPFRSASVCGAAGSP